MILCSEYDIPACTPLSVIPVYEFVFVRICSERSKIRHAFNTEM